LFDAWGAPTLNDKQTHAHDSFCRIADMSLHEANDWLLKLKIADPV